MGVYIPKMEMPTRCEKCDLAYDDDGYFACPFTKAFYKSKQRPSWCPLIEVKPHGRLIDADALRILYDFKNYKPTMTEEEFDRLMCTLPVIRANIDDAPTIIEAEVCNDTCNKLQDSCNKAEDDPINANIESEGEE